MKKAIVYLLKHSVLIQTIYRIVFNSVFKIWSLFIKVDQKKVLFVSYGGKQFSDSPKVLYEALKKDLRFKEYKFIWAFENPDDFADCGLNTIKIDTIEYFYTAMSAKIWITNVNIERGLNFKPKETIYLNTWHGTGPKKGGNAVKGRKDYDFSRVDIFCCDGEYTKSVFKRYWNLKDSSVLMCGRPREDELFSFNDDDKKRILSDLGIQNKKIILYMPTWREWSDYEIDYQKWEMSLKENYVMLVRSHHFSNKDFPIENNGFYYDVTKYNNVNELYYIADILVSDYSSSIFDYGLLGKPIICLCKDYDRFDEYPGLFMDLRNEFPDGICETDSEAINRIINMDYAKMSETCLKYVNKYVSHNENATNMCIEALHSKL